MRTVAEWVAKHDDQAIPKLVKLRIWEREGGRCYLSGRKIQYGEAFQYEHVIALSHGGEHRESNIKLALTEPHKVKTRQDVKTAAKLKRVALKHRGLWPKSKAQIRSRGFAPTRPIDTKSRDKSRGRG